MKKTVIAILFIIASGFAFSDTADIPVMSLDEVRRALDKDVELRGYMLTTLEGFKIDTFDVEIKGIRNLRKDFSGMPVVVIKLSGGPEEYPAEHILIAAGESGSPVYIYTDEGIKDLGALAFVPSYYNKDPIALVQLSETMLKGGKSIEIDGVQEQFQLIEYQQNQLIPIMFSGPFKLTDKAKELFKQRELELIDASAFLQTSTYENTSDSVYVERKIHPGSAINVYMVTGDIEMAANGTVARIDNSTFYGFGHQFFGSGPTSLPVTHPRMITTIANQRNSYKYPENNGAFVGRVEYDYYWGIKGTLGKQPENMVSLSFNLRNKDKTRDVNCQVAQIPDVTSWLSTLITYYVLNGGYEEFNMDRQSDHGSITIKMSLDIEGIETLTPAPYIISYTRESFDNEVLDYVVYGFWFRILDSIYDNGTKVTAINFDIEYSTDYQFLELTSALFDRSRASAGDSLNLFLTLYSSDFEEKFTKRVPFLIPKNVALERVDVQVKSGNKLSWKGSGSSRKLSAGEKIDLINSFDNTFLYVKADFTRMDFSSAKSKEQESDSVLVDSLGWEILSTRKKQELPLIVLEKIFLPAEFKNDVPVISNYVLSLDIVTKLESEQEQQRLDAEEKSRQKQDREKKWWHFWRWLDFLRF